MRDTMTNTAAITAWYSGQVPYREAWQMQQEVHRQVQSGQLPGAILLMEHPPVITLGKHADREHILGAVSKKVDIVQSDRGGEVTAHMPGQLIIYPVLPLGALRINVRQYVGMLQESVIELLGHYGLAGRVDAEYPGVWLGMAKICAVGVRIQRRISLHGLSINVNNDLDLFTAIVPCGIRGRGVTSMRQALGKPLVLHEIMGRIVPILAKRLQLPIELADVMPSLPSEALAPRMLCSSTRKV